jgi:hypothetical protein
MKPIAAPLVGGMITSTIHALILVPLFFALMKERAPRRGCACREFCPAPFETPKACNNVACLVLVRCSPRDVDLDVTDS